MSTPHVLVVYFSRSGHTRALAERIAAARGWDLDEICEPRPRPGWRGYLRSVVEAASGQTTAILPPARWPADYDLVVVGTPVWASSLASPVRSYLHEHRGELRRVAFFLTQGGTEHRRVLRQMESAALRAPVATLAIREAQLKDGLDERVSRFVADLERALTLPAPAAPEIAPQPAPPTPATSH